VTLALLLSVGIARAQRSQEENKTVPLEGAARLEVDVEFGAGRLFVRGADLTDQARLKVYYDPRYVDFDVDYTKREETGRLILESDVNKRGHWDEDEGLDNEWDLELPTGLPIALLIDMGACEADLDLGGLRLTEVDMNVGASSGRIDFSSPNPERMRELTIDIGASSLDIRGLGNANVERISCKVGAGSCDLDFRSGVKGDCTIDLDVGVGSADIVVPKDVALRVEGDDGWFSDLDFKGLDLDETRRNVWETDDFGQATDRLTIRADVAMGSISIRGRR